MVKMTDQNEKLKEAIYWINMIVGGFLALAAFSTAIEKTIAIIKERRWVYTYELYNERERKSKWTERG